MLPGSGGGLRHRGSAASNMTQGVHRLQSVMNDSVRRYHRLPFMGKLVLGLSLVFSALLYAAIFHYMTTHDVTHDNFLDVPKCPACLGSSGCGLVYYDQIQLTGWSRYKFTGVFNNKNIRYATMSGDQKVVLKKFGSDDEIAALDRRVCQDAKRGDDCDVARVLFLTDIAVALRKEQLQPKHLTQAAGMFTCASYRLMDRFWGYYKEARKKKTILLGDQLQVWYTASLNPEPLLLQTFPASERWPFPEYFGACGRQVIVEHVGRTLQEFYHEPFHTRAGLAYELLKIADHFTNNEEDFALYITDPNWTNFGVDASGKVRVLDAENIIVVDKLAIDAKKKKGYDEFLESKHDLCSDSSCLSMIPEQLCARLHSDHNYYAVCTNLLDPSIDDGVMPGGLLHDMPEEASDFWDLDHLLRECARPSRFKGRLAAKDKLLTALHRLHDQSQDHLRPPPPLNKAGVPKYPQKKKELWEYDDYDDDDDDKKKEGKEGMKEGGDGAGEKKQEGERNRNERGDVGHDVVDDNELGKRGVILD